MPVRLLFALVVLPGVTGFAPSPFPKLHRGAILSARIDSPAEIDSSAAGLDAVLVLTNDGDVPLRVCTLAHEWRFYAPDIGRFEHRYRPDFWKSEHPLPEAIARHIVTLAPGKSVSLPFRVPRTEYAGRTSFTVIVGYAVERDFYKLWRGKSEAAPRTIKVRQAGRR